MTRYRRKESFSLNFVLCDSSLSTLGSRIPIARVPVGARSLCLPALDVTAKVLFLVGLVPTLRIAAQLSSQLEVSLSDL